MRWTSSLSPKLPLALYGRKIHSCTTQHSSPPAILPGKPRAVNHVVEMQRSGNDGHPNVTVERKICISVECDALKVLQEMVELNDGGVETFQEAFELVQPQVMPDKEQSRFIATLDLYIGVFGIRAAAKT
jgi:hypothetical protein